MNEDKIAFEFKLDEFKLDEFEKKHSRFIEKYVVETTRILTKTIDELQITESDKSRVLCTIVTNTLIRVIRIGVNEEKHEEAFECISKFFKDLKKSK